MGPKPVSQAAIQNVRPTYTSSESPEGFYLLRPNWHRIIQGRLRRRVEGRILDRCCCEGHEDLLKQRLAEYIWQVLQGGCDLESPPALECPAANRRDDVRVSICDGLELDAEWEHQRVREGKPRYEPVETARSRCKRTDPHP